MFSPRLPRTRVLCLLIFLATPAAAWTQNLGNAWHIPDDNHDVDTNTSAATANFVHMRDPRFEFALGSGTATTLNFYQAVYKGAGDNETGNGKLWYRALPASGTPGAWASVPLGFFSDEYNTSPDFRQVWKASLNGASFNADDAIQYYFEVTFDNRATTFLYGGDADPGLGNQRKSALRSDAEAAPYSVRNRPAFVFHANNRVLSGNNVQFSTKVGYQSKSGNVRWADRGTLYYTLDGTDPAGSLGVAGNAGTQAVALAFDHPENDNSPAGNAMWWVSPSVNLPSFTNVKYRIGFWNSANNEEKFADYNAPTDTSSGHVFNFSIGTAGAPVLTVNGKGDDYTTTHVFVNEQAGDAPPITVGFDPAAANVNPGTVQVFTNLNRRDLATQVFNGVEEGIQPPSGDLVDTGDGHYYKAYAMTQTAAGHYETTLPATRTGAYRLTARYKTTTAPNTWVYYTSGGRHDHAVVVSPTKSRNINLYEVNTLNLNASGTLESQRGTFADLFDPSKRANLDYIKNLGCNFLWFQPIHPNGIDGRQIDPVTGAAFEVGSPYAVKNFFEVMPLMSRANTRPAAMTEFQQFVAAADAKGMGVMLDAPFNHTSYDCELAAKGVELFAPGANATDEIRNREARVFSANNDYANRASGASSIAVAPDRGDFGKFDDTYDIFYGSYSALVDNNPGDNGGYLNEGDIFFYGDTDWTSTDFTANGQPQNVTKNVWKYFADYLVYWITQTGGTPQALAGNPDLGIDALRADFGQGLPPQAWEYIINKTRSLKWNFVFMTESLDGGAVTYRSNRHFDILNENIVFPFQAASTTSNYRNIFDTRRDAYGQGLVLMNSTSHDEENYVDPYQALVRYAVSGSVDGVPLIFYGQENGISRTFGFDRYETNFGKQITHFKKFNSLGPILAYPNRNFGLDQLYPVYAAVGQARQFSPALRSSNRFYLNLKDGSEHGQIFSAAKFEQRNASPNLRDVVLAFVNVDRDASPLTVGTNKFNVAVDVDNDGQNDFGIRRGRRYNVRNIAAYTALHPERRDVFLITGGITGDDLLDNGLYVAMNRVPVQVNGPEQHTLAAFPAWDTAPFEAQYLKLYDVTPPPTANAPAAPKAYALGTSVTFSWDAVSDPDGGVSGYRLIVGTTPGGSDVFNGNVGNVTTYTLTNQPYGRVLYARIVAVNNAGVEGAASSPASASVTVLDPRGDQDGDGVLNDAEDLAGTNLFDPRSNLRVLATSRQANNAGVQVTWTSVPGKTYVVQATTDLQNVPFADVSGAVIPAAAAPATQTSYTDATAPAGSPRKFYRVRVVSP